MAGRCCIPIENASGELVAYAGRLVGEGDPPEGQDKYQLPKGFHNSALTKPGFSRATPARS